MLSRESRKCVLSPFLSPSLPPFSANGKQFVVLITVIFHSFDSCSTRDDIKP